VDADFNHVDGFDVLFGKGSSNTLLKLKNTNPGTFHYELKLTNETGTELHRKGVTISDRNGGEVTVILTVPSLPLVPGVTVPASASTYTDVTKGAFLTRSSHPVNAHPEEREHEEMAMDVRYALSAPGGDCTSPAVIWTVGQPREDTRVKCIAVSGLTIPKHGKATIRVNYEFAPKGTDLWPGNSQLMFRAGFLFRSATRVRLDDTFPIVLLRNKEYTSAQAVGLVGAGQRVTAVGGFVLDEFGMPFMVAPGSLTVRLFNVPPANSATTACTTAVPVASDLVSADGFYFIWRNGQVQSTNVGTTELTSGIKYYVAVCSGTTLISSSTLRDRLASKDFDEQDFYIW